MKTLILSSILFWTIPGFAGSVQYTYDVAGRLAKAGYGGGKQIAYAYDPAGNLLRRLVELGGAASADVAVLAPVPFGSFEFGRGNLVCAFCVTNAGSLTATGVRLTSHLPPQALFVSASEGALDNGVFAANLGDLIAGASRDIQLELLPLTNGVLLSTATVSTDASEANLANNSITCTTTILVAPDTDANGLPDWWEQQYFPNLADRIAAADFDGDGLCNGDEYLAGTDPANKASLLAIFPLQKSLDRCSLSFPTAPGRLYEMEAASQLRPPLWSSLASNLPGTGHLLTVTDTNLSTTRFYRLRAILP